MRCKRIDLVGMLTIPNDSAAPIHEPAATGGFQNPRHEEVLLPGGRVQSGGARQAIPDYGNGNRCFPSRREEARSARSPVVGSFQTARRGAFSGEGASFKMPCSVQQVS